MLLWECHCTLKVQSPEEMARHCSKCSVAVPAGWYRGWQGDTPPVAGRLNRGPTPPGEVLIGWRKP